MEKKTTRKINRAAELREIARRAMWHEMFAIPGRIIAATVAWTIFKVFFGG